MSSAKLDSRGFTLIATLLLLLLLSGFACALLMMVNTEQRSGGFDLNNTYTYRAAEGGMEKLTSDVAATFQSIQSPTNTQICAVGQNPPTWDSTVSYTCPSCAYNAAPSPGYSASYPCPALPNPVPWGPIQSGPEAGLYAQILPITLNVTAQRADGLETVSMTRTAEVALIPVFQFGVFSDSDLFFGQSPNLGFAGRVHTNGDLYLGVANGYNLVFGDKLSAFGNVIREQMDNGQVVGNGLDDGTVLLPTTSNGCSTQLTALWTGKTVSDSSTCVNIASSGVGLGATNGSVVGGHGSSQYSGWYNASTGALANFLIDGNGPDPVGSTNDGPDNTGATDLTLPFVSTTGGATAIQIIRQPLPSTSTTSLLGASQLAYEAQIRVILSDTQNGLHLPDYNGDNSGDVQLVGVMPTALTGLLQGASTGGSQALAEQVGGGYPATSGHYYYFGESYCAGSVKVGSGLVYGSTCPTTNGGDNNFVIPPHYGPPYPWANNQAFPTPNSTNYGGAQTGSGTNTALEWPLIGGWLRVEAKWNDSVWHPVTKEWLALGFARGVNVPTVSGKNCTAPPATNTLSTAPSCNYLADHRNAILYFQMTKDSQMVGQPSVNADYPLTGAGVYYDSSSATYKSQYNWYPLNLYDAREGENYDAGTFNTGANSGTGTPNGIMNVIELDVGNLQQWLLGNIGTTGTNVNYTAQNGYILYFSDRRGMQFATSAQGANYQWQWGEYGFEDTVNFANLGGNLMPDGALDPVNYNGISPEDVNGNLQLDKYGVVGVGDAWGASATTHTDGTNPPNPFADRIALGTYGLANRVTGARHVLKLVDGSLGQLPTMPPASGCSYTNSQTQAPQPTGCGGFTVGSENPVYILGNYNSNCPQAGAAGCVSTNATYDPTWSNAAAAEPNHAAASVIADAVTLLSNNWTDAGCQNASATICKATTSQGIGNFYNTTGSLNNPLNPGGEGSTPNRFAATTYYRVAVAGGKTIAFTDTTGTPDAFFGSDGGVHNFLRQLEDWSVPGSGGNTLQSMYYKGSLVSFYWNAYATGTWKCCTYVYHPPNRQYVFDPLFSMPQNLPPGTPMFRNVDNLSYRQNQIARTN